MTALGLPGVWTYGFGEGWAHLYQDSVATNHNAIGRGYETFGNATAETVERRLDPERNRFTGRPVTERDWYRMVPPPQKLKWSLRNNTNYMQTGVLAALEYTARNVPEMLWNFWRRGANGVRRGTTEKPYAIAIPERQDDRRRLARLVNLLREHGIEVSRAKSAFELKEGDFPAGTYLVRMDQPYRGYALDLLTPQRYPADKAPYDAYDDVAWALPVSLGVEVRPIEDEAVRQVPLAPVAAPVAYKGHFASGGAAYLVRDSGQEALLAGRVRLAGFEVEAAAAPFRAGGRDYPAGSWVLPAQPGLEPVLESVATELALDVDAVAALPETQARIQIYARNNQEILDSIIQAYKIAESVYVPVMVCYDGFVLSHTEMPVNLPSQEDVDKFLPPYRPHTRLDPANPRNYNLVTFANPRVNAEGVLCHGYMELRYLLQEALQNSRETIIKVGQEFGEVFGRNYSSTLWANRLDDANTVTVAMGSLAMEATGSC